MVTVVSVAGIAICVLWFFHTLAFTALYGAKFKQTGKMEETMTFKNFREEYDTLSADWRYKPLTYIECGVAIVFLALFIATIKL
jgi:hypothetical protein